MTKFVKLYRDADANSGGGLPPSLADLENTNGMTNLQDVPPSEAPAPDPVEGVNPDGSLEEGYTKDLDGNVIKETTVEEEPSEDDPPASTDLDPSDFWTEVDTITGKPVEVDYGDTDPLSPEGVALRESVVRDSAVQDFDEYMRETYPRAYAYFLHVQNGGADEQFFAEPTLGIIDRDSFEQDPDIQAAWLMRDFQRKGVPEEIAQASIDKYIKDSVLQEKALKLYVEQEANDRAKLKYLEEEDKNNRLSFQNNVSQLSNNIAKAIKTEMKLLVPDAKQAEFQQSVIDKIQHDGQRFYIVQELGDNLNTVLDSMYLQFVKGDLNSIIEKRAQTKAVQRLGAKIAADKRTQSGGEPNTQKTKYVSLGEI